MIPRYVEAVQYLHPEVDWTLPPNQWPIRVEDDGSGAKVTEWRLEGSPPSDADATMAISEKDDAANAEILRVATYADDPEVTDGLTQIKSGTAAEIDAYVEQTIVLTATDLEGLKAEVQTVLRGLARRQLKVQFDPAHLLGQLDTAKKQAAIVKEKKP